MDIYKKKMNETWTTIWNVNYEKCPMDWVSIRWCIIGVICVSVFKAAFKVWKMACLFGIVELSLPHEWFMPLIYKGRTSGLTTNL